MNVVSRDSIARIIDNEFCDASWLVCLDAADRILAAIADTHPKDGDVEQAPLVSGGGAEGNRPETTMTTLSSHKYSMKGYSGE